MEALYKLFQRPITVYMFATSMILLGIVSLYRLPISLMPSIENPAITIITRYPGISPSKIEEILTKPIEEQISSVGNIQSIYSSSEEGESRINITFGATENIAKKSLDARARIDLIRSSFPREVEEPTITRFDPTDRPIFIVKLESNKLSLKELRTFAENKLKKKFERVDGISEINIGGGFEREISVKVDKEKLGFHKLKISEVMDALDRSNINLPVGQIRENDRLVNVKLVGRYTSIGEIPDTVIKVTSQDKILRLKDLALVNDGFRDRENISRENGKEIVAIFIQKAGDANSLEVCQELRSLVAEVHSPGIEINVNYDQSIAIQDAIDRVIQTAIYGGLIAIAVLFLFIRSIYAVCLISLSIPISIIITFSIMNFYKVGIDVMSLSGLALGVGMIVDSSIIIIESSFLKYQKFGFNKNIHFESASSVATELFASVLTNIAVFLPFLFASKETNQLYGGLAITVSGTLIISLIVSIILIPVLASTFFLKRNQQFQESEIWKTIHSMKVPMPKWNVFSFIKKINYLNIQEYYKRSLLFTLENPKKLYITYCILIIFGIFSIIFLKQEYMDPSDTGEIRASVELETGIHLDATNKKILELESILSKQESIQKVTSKVEKWHADVNITLKPEFISDTVNVIENLKIETESIPGIFVFFSEAGPGADSKELDVEFIGDDSKTLQEIAKEAAKIIGGIEGIQQVALRFREGKDEIVLNFDRKKAGSNRLSSADVANAMKTSLTGSIPTKFLEDDKEVDIKVRFDQKDRMDLAQVLSTSFPSSDKSTVFLSSLIDLEERKGETRIYRKNKRKVATISAKLGTLDTGTAVQRISGKLSSLELPSNYYFEFGDSYKKLQKNQYEMFFLFSISGIIIYLLLAMLFESFYYPLLIIFCVPSGIFASLIFLFFMRMTLNISVYIGLIMLTGIAVNNAIILVDSVIKDLSNQPWKEKVINCSLDRLRPILITTMTTVLGLLPTAISTGSGSQLWRPLGITVVIGLSVSSIFTLYLIPTLILIKRSQTEDTL
ncbi:efflux RND transporter permease subunit [Leptospira yanagawae]|uniref:Efflux RND transporter permease subunit n=1 Tax=Leptospira yanagawae TaxID=293069 RepID=A0ABY2LZH2_9LEPT|nr:efflux RND transporter permease subunit [Leptospira yanagawae]TGL17934.1 efflux RND transporter permease subunit [Leptospira yanagawae]